MKKEVTKIETDPYEMRILTVKYSPSNFIEKIFRKSFTKQFVETNPIYTIDELSLWLNYPSRTIYGRSRFLDEYINENSNSIHLIR